MAARLLTLVVLTVLVAGALLMSRLYSRHRVRQTHKTPQDTLWAALGTEPDGRATIVGFRTSACGECQVQAEELKPLIAQDVRVVEIDAGKEPGAARAFGVLAAPSTAVLAPDGRLLAVNRRLVPHRVLRAQLDLEGAPPV